jgi:hypothetical protein
MSAPLSLVFNRQPGEFRINGFAAVTEHAENCLSRIHKRKCGRK